MTIEITLVGGRGHTGEELLGLVAAHPDMTVVRVGSRSLAGRRVNQVFPAIESELCFEHIAPGAIDPASVGDRGAVVLALPNGAASTYADALPTTVPIIDLSADYRFDQAWYYGLPELNPRAPDSPVRVANPGCYATAVQLALAPLADAFTGWPSAFGVSGYSGAGRKPSPRNDPERLRDNLLPYALAGHMHEREISHRLGTPVRFSPHVAPFFRGISVTCTATLGDETSVEALRTRYREHYAGAELVEVTAEIPEIRDVAGTPRARIGGITVDERDPRCVVVVAVIDNLLKGAASQAIQNLNALFGLPSTRGLIP